MQDQPSQGRCDPRIERVIILQLLRDDHGDRWSRAELEVEISNVEPCLWVSTPTAIINFGLHSLVGAGDVEAARQSHVEHSSTLL